MKAARMTKYGAISLIILLARGLTAQPIDQQLPTPILNTPNAPTFLLNGLPSDPGVQPEVAEEKTCTMEFMGGKVMNMDTVAEQVLSMEAAANGQTYQQTVQQPLSPSFSIPDPSGPTLNELPSEPGVQIEIAVEQMLNMEAAKWQNYEPTVQQFSSPSLSISDPTSPTLNEFKSDQGVKNEVAEGQTFNTEGVKQQVLIAEATEEPILNTEAAADGQIYEQTVQQLPTQSFHISDPLRPTLNESPSDPGVQKEAAEEQILNMEAVDGRTCEPTVQQLSPPSFSVSEPTMPTLNEFMSDPVVQKEAAVEQILNVELAEAQNLTPEAAEQKVLITEAATEQTYSMVADEQTHTEAAEVQAIDLGNTEEQVLNIETKEKGIFLTEAAREPSLNVISEAPGGNSSDILIDQNAKRELTQVTPLVTFTPEPTIPAIIVQMIPDQELPNQEIRQQTVRTDSHDPTELLNCELGIHHQEDKTGNNELPTIKHAKSLDKTETAFNNGLTNEYLKYLHSRGILDENGNEVMEDEELQVDDPQVTNYFNEELLSKWDILSAEQRKPQQNRIIITNNISGSAESLGEIQREQKMSTKQEPAEAWDSWVEQQLEAYLNHLKGIKCKCETTTTAAPTKKVEVDWIYKEPIIEDEMPSPPVAVSYQHHINYATRQKPVEKTKPQEKNTIAEEQSNKKAKKQTVRIAHPAFQEFLETKFPVKEERRKRNKGNSKNKHKTRKAKNGKNKQTEELAKSQPQSYNTRTKKYFDEGLQDGIKDSTNSQHSGKHYERAAAARQNPGKGPPPNVYNFQPPNTDNLETLEKTKKVLLRLKDTLHKFKTISPPNNSQDEKSLEKVKKAPQRSEPRLRKHEVLSPPSQYQKSKPKMQVKSLDEKMTPSLRKYFENTNSRNRHRKRSDEQE